MPMPELAVLAEGDLPTGEHWRLRGGGTARDYYTFLETVHPDGHSDEGGMGGPPLYPGAPLNVYSGGVDRSLHRVIARGDLRVRALRLELATGEHRELRPVATDSALGVTFFAALLPWRDSIVALRAIGADGQEIVP
jgi:hypothetical protein